MRDTWFADKRDLIKWGVLLKLAELFEAERILQLAFYRSSDFPQLVIDGVNYNIPEEVLAHFRNIRTVGSLGSKVRVTVFDPVFEDRHAHLQAVLTLLPAFMQERCIVFLDPDTGLEPQRPTLDHALDSEVHSIWNAMKKGDVFSLYQHQTTRAKRPWIEEKRTQLARALDLSADSVKVANSPHISNDIVFFYAHRA